MKILILVTAFALCFSSSDGMVAPEEQAQQFINDIVKKNKEVPEHDLLTRNAQRDITDKPLLDNLALVNEAFFKTKDAQKLLFLLLQVTSFTESQVAIECINKLLDKGATFDPSLKTYQNNNLLHWACWQTNLRAVKAISAQKDCKDLIHKINSIGDTPLFIAVYGGYASEEIVKELLSVGASVTVVNNNKETPLHGAYKSDIVLQLLQKGADVNAKAKFNATPLHRAAWYGRLEAAKVLLAHGADANAQTDMTTNYDDAGNTPLHSTAFRGDVEMAKFMVAYDADLTIKNKKGQTALDVAIHALQYPQEKSKNTVRFLIQLGAKVNKAEITAAAGETRSLYMRPALMKLGILDKNSMVIDSNIQKIYDAGQSVREEVEEIKKSGGLQPSKKPTKEKLVNQPIKSPLELKLDNLNQKLLALKNNLEMLKNKLGVLKKKL